MAVINRIADALAAEAQRPKQRKRKGVTFVNDGAVAGVVEYLAFEFPVGSGRTWRVAPIPYLTGQKIAALELEMLEIEVGAKAERDREGVNVEALRGLQDHYNDIIERAAAVAGPLMIPTGPRKWRRRWARRFGHNPLAKASDKDVASVLGFLARCLMTSQSRVRQVAPALN